MSDIDKLIEVILKEAKERDWNAAYSGSHGDGGAGILYNQVKFYNYGRKGIIPDEWKRFEKLLDPEYQLYLQLKNKYRN